jgi:predicted DsbA family dithiol-disulfide isomerase
MEAGPRTIVVYSDITCPWAHAAVARLHETRDRLGLADTVRFDHRAFVLELANDRPTPWTLLHAEIPVLAAIEPAAGWRMWDAPPWQWPVSSLLALEAVQAAKAQSMRASEELDLGLRRALFAESRCITMRHVVVDVARDCASVDVSALEAALDDGRARIAVMEQWRGAEAAGAKGSPHLFLPDGTDVHNPGVEMHMQGEKGRSFPVVDADDRSVYDDLVKRAAT